MIVIRKGRQIVRCDGCSKAPENLDNFDSFYISWPGANHPVTGEPRVIYLSMKHDAGLPTMLHSCPACAKRVRGSLKVNKLDLLPEGPLKVYLKTIVDKAGNTFRAFQIHFLKDSRIGHA